MARCNRENQLAQQCRNNGISEENYPQYGTSFWGSNSADNYGFGTSNISSNIENVTNRLNSSGIEIRSKDKDFDRVFNKSLIEEGGYEYKPNKIDTPTNMGIQQSTLDRFKNAHTDLSSNYPQHIKDITYPQVKQIMRTDYFDKYRIGEIDPERIQETMFDSFLNHSPEAPARWAQKAINQNSSYTVDEDGIFGSQTINALNSLTPEETVKVNNAIIDMRQADYEHELKSNGNPNYKNYTKGLPNRFEKFRIK